MGMQGEGAAGLKADSLAPKEELRAELKEEIRAELKGEIRAELDAEFLFFTKTAEAAISKALSDIDLKQMVRVSTLEVFSMMDSHIVSEVEKRTVKNMDVQLQCKDAVVEVRAAVPDVCPAGNICPPQMKDIPTEFAVEKSYVENVSVQSQCIEAIVDVGPAVEICSADSICSPHMKDIATESEEVKFSVENLSVLSQCFDAVVQKTVRFDDSPNIHEYVCNGNLLKLPVGNLLDKQSVPSCYTDVVDRYGNVSAEALFAELTVCLEAPGLGVMVCESFAEEDLTEFDCNPQCIPQLAKMVTRKCHSVWPCGLGWVDFVQDGLVSSFQGFHDSFWTAISEGNTDAISKLCADIGEVVGEGLTKYGIEFNTIKVKRVSTGIIADTDFAEFCGQGAKKSSWSAGADRFVDSSGADLSG